MEIRRARRTDNLGLVALIYSAGPELYDYLYKTDKSSAQDYITFEFLSGRGFCGYPNVTVALRDRQIVGTGCFYDAARYGRLALGTAWNMFRFYGPIGFWPVLKRSLHIGSVMKKPGPGELYLSNFGVAREHRSTGVGRALINTRLAVAKARGYQRFGLDVADNNPRAEQLYRQLGLQEVEFKQFTGKRKDMHIPNSKKMELRLAQSPATQPLQQAA
ncbi:MAG: GNAT family N-acetyltransferase [Acidobacteriota bacterium]